MGRASQRKRSGGSGAGKAGAPRLASGERPPGGGRRQPGFALAALGVFAVALGLRLVHLWQLRGSPLLELYLGDAAGYHAWAARLAGGDWLGSEVFYQAPLYPYVLGVLYAAVGEGLAVRVVQALLGATACVLLALAGNRLFSARVGLVAGLGLALYPTAIFFDGLIQKSVLDSLLLCLLLWLLSRRIVAPGGPAGWFAVGAVLGALVLTRENALVFLLPVLAWPALDGRVARRERAIAAALLLAGLALPLGPVALRNFAVGGGFQLTTSQAGPNFYIGNHRGASGLYEPLRFGRGDVDFERADATELAEEAMGRPLAPGEVSAYWRTRALADIAARPGAWLGLMARKAALVWNAAEIEDTEDQASYARWSAPLRWSAFLDFRWVAALAALGAWMSRRRWRELWPLHSMIVVYAGSVALFFVLGRYRFPLVPLLLPFAAVGLAEAAAWVRRGPRSEVLAGSLLALGMAAFASLPLYDAGVSTVTTQINLGKEFLDRGELERAGEQLEGALAADPGHPLAHFNLGTVRQLQGRSDEAIFHFRQSLAAEPGNVEAWNNLGVALAAAGDPAGAFESYRKAVELDPGDAAALTNLAGALAGRGLVPEALENFDAAIRADSSYVLAYLNKAKVLASMGSFREAQAVLDSASEVAPDDPELRRLRAALAARSGDAGAPQ